MNNTILALDPTALREILIVDVGIDPDALTEAAPDATLADLGLDSLAQVELGVVLHNRYGVEQVPDAMSAMTFDELVGHVCGLTG